MKKEILSDYFNYLCVHILNNIVISVVTKDPG